MAGSRQVCCPNSSILFT